MSVNDASRIVIDYSRVTLQIVASLTDDFRGIKYNHNLFLVKATGDFFIVGNLLTRKLIICWHGWRIPDKSPIVGFNPKVSLNVYREIG